MRRASAISVVLLIGALTLATFTSTGHAKSLRQTAMVTFERPTWVATAMLVGTYIVEHDDGRMAVGEPCTVFYRVLPGTRPMEEVVAFDCIPRERSATPNFSTRVVRDPITGVDTL